MDFIKELPISSHYEEIRDWWFKYGSFAIKSPTGSGKSLGLPLFFYKEGLVKGKIFVVQPRRIAARSLARVASRFCQSELGEEVGYRVRFDTKVSSATKVVYLTDGMLFRILQHPKNLEGVELIIFDEFHERTVYMDASLALCKSFAQSDQIFPKIIVTSATLNLIKVSEYLEAPNGLEIERKEFPVSIRYKATTPNTSLQVQVCDNLLPLLRQTEGDVLIFMDGAAEIRRAVREIQCKLHSSNFEVLPLFGEMSQESQDLALRASSKRKIIVSTNLAETSLTIEGVSAVIDTGLAKKHRFDPYRRVNVLLTEPISKSSADQRAGRAGRLSAGICLRMWSENQHLQRSEFEEPEIERLDLTEIYLNLTAQGIKPKELNWYEQPPIHVLNEAEEFLVSLEAIDCVGNVLLRGKELAKLPIHPRIGYALHLAKEKKCLSQLALVSAALDFKNPIDFGKRSDFSENGVRPTSDLVILLNAFMKARKVNFRESECRKLGVHGLRFREIENSARQLCSIMEEEFEFNPYVFEKLIEILLEVYPERLAYLENQGTNTYRDSTGLCLKLSKESTVVGSKWILPLKILEKKRQGKIILEMDEVTSIAEGEIRKVLGGKITLVREVYLDTVTHHVFEQSLEKFGEVIIGKKDSIETSREKVAKAYARAIIEGELKLKNWNNEVEAFLSRINFLSVLYPEYQIESFDENLRIRIINEICLSGKKWKEIRNAKVLHFIHSYYGNEKLKILDLAAPASFSLSNSSKAIPLRYDNQKVYMQAPIQKFYGVEDHPKVAFGKSKIMVELLAPNGRVVQCTDNILEFWNGSYLSIKKELAGRYPKHDWK